MTKDLPDQPSDLDVWLDRAVDVIQTSIPGDDTRDVLRHALKRASIDVTIEQMNDDQRRLLFPLLKQSTLTLDECFISTFGLSDTVRREYDRDKNGVLFLNRLVSLTLLLQEYDPDKTRDFCAALCKRVGAEGGDTVPVDVRDIPDGVKEFALRKMFDVHLLPDTHRMETLRWVLGQQRFLRWKTRFGKHHEKYIQRLAVIIDRSEGIRRKLLLALDRFATMPVQFLAGAIARQGWVYLAENTKEITDHEWWKSIERDAVHEGDAAATQEMAASCLDRLVRKHQGTIKRTKNVQTKKKHKKMADSFRCMAHLAHVTAKVNRKNAAPKMNDTKKYFATHPEIPPARKLVDIIDWRGWQKKLQIAQAERHATRLGTLQKQLALDVFFHVERMESGRKEHVSSAEENQNGVPDYVRGFPVEIVNRKEGSCFGGLWLVASLLLKCGIRPEQLRFCHINKDADGQIGAHAELLLLTENKEILIIDFGFNVCGRDLRLQGTNSGWTLYEMQNLIEGSQTEPVIWNADPYFTERWKYPQSMIVMPVFEGFAHTHLWHTGIELLHEGKTKEAKEAFRIARSLCPKNPDVLYYLGIVASQSGDLQSAKAYLHDAIVVFKGHLRSHETLGKIALLEGDEGEALRRFTLVATDESSIWGDDTFKKEAIEYRESWKKAHPEEQKEPLTYQI